MVCDITAVMPMYQKFLRANLTTGAYEIGLVAEDEKVALSENMPATIQEYFRWFGSSSFIHEEDRSDFLEAVKTIDAGASIIYQRIIDGSWKRVVMQLVPAQEYSADNKDCIIYVRDIETIYQQEYLKVLDKIGTTDQMTGLYNKVAFERDKNNCKTDYVGVVYADVNGLKWTNDNLGHKSGDELIVKFANLLALRFGNKSRCYHLSGDEFAVLSYGCPLKDFLAAAVGLHKGLWNTAEYPMASIGYSVGKSSEIQDILEEAEREMYDDKRMFYSKFPKYIRK